MKQLLTLLLLFGFVCLPASAQTRDPRAVVEQALSEACYNGTLEGFTPLMTAAAEGQLEVVRLLLIHGANPKLLGVGGDSAKSFAEQNGHTAVIDLLKNPPPRIGGTD